MDSITFVRPHDAGDIDALRRALVEHVLAYTTISHPDLASCVEQHVSIALAEFDAGEIALLQVDVQTGLTQAQIDETARTAVEAYGVPVAKTTTQTPMPLCEDLYHCQCQFWYDPEASRGKSTWRVKLRYATTEAEAVSPERTKERLIGFSRSARAARYGVWARAKRSGYPEAWASRFDRVSRNLDKHQVIAPITLSLYDCFADREPGRSSNAKSFSGQFAVLTLAPDGVSPHQIDLYLDEGEPLVISSIKAVSERNKDGSRRKAGAAQWVAYHDPDHRVLSSETYRARQARQQAAEAVILRLMGEIEAQSEIIQRLRAEIALLRGDRTR